MDTQSYDTSRLFTTDSGPYCDGSCPFCDCGSYNWNDIWYVEYQDYFDLEDGSKHCAQCVCKKDSEGNLYADCDDAWPWSYQNGESTCDEENGPDLHQCHHGYTSSGDFFFFF